MEQPVEEALNGFSHALVAGDLDAILGQSSERPVDHRLGIRLGADRVPLAGLAQWFGARDADRRGVRIEYSERWTRQEQPSPCSCTHSSGKDGHAPRERRQVDLSLGQAVACSLGPSILTVRPTRGAPAPRCVTVRDSLEGEGRRCSSYDSWIRGAAERDRHQLWRHLGTVQDGGTERGQTRGRRRARAFLRLATGDHAVLWRLSRRSSSSSAWPWRASLPSGDVGAWSRSKPRSVRPVFDTEW